MIADEITHLIGELRNHRDVDTNWPAFRSKVENNLEEILKSCSSRWLVSICDTYVDYGEPIQARHAMVISFFMNMVRFSETVKFVRPEVSQERLNQTRDKLVPLYDGLNTFAIDRQDVFLNLTRRFAKLLEDDSLMWPIWSELLRRLHDDENVITDFSRESRVGDRYFPLDASGLKDNYGL